MDEPLVPTPPPRPQYAWYVVLCLLGLDYFSSLAYLPSLALAQARGLPGDDPRAFAPLAALGVVVLTLFAALPVYLYVVGRSPHGQGAVGLLERRWPGWGGKLLVLVLLGFVATDYVLTRSLSTADAAEHLTANQLFREGASLLTRNPDKVREALPEFLRGSFFDALSERVVVSVALAFLSFALYFYLVRSLNRGFLGFAVAVVVLYLLLNAVVVGSSLAYLRREGTLIANWEVAVRPALSDLRHGGLYHLAVIALFIFPPMAIGLSGFELSIASAPLVKGSDADDPGRPAWRIFNARLMMVAAALIMSVYVLASTFVVSLLVPGEALFAGDVVHHRALSHLAHGGGLTNGGAAVDEISPLFGRAFGTLYDLSTVLILCLAGATATLTLKDLVPEFLGKFGMQLGWARRLGVVTHLFNALILVLTVVFRASVTDLMWGYAASVLALLFGAAFAASFDVRTNYGALASLPFRLIGLVFLVMLVMVAYHGPSGVLIAGGFVLVVLVSGVVSRWLRGTEPRFEPFAFADAESERRFRAAVGHEYQVLMPHAHTDRLPQDIREAELRRDHGLAASVPVLFVEVELGDRGDLPHGQPLLTVVSEGGREVIRVRGSRSVPHTLAAVALACREVGRPPDLHFGRSQNGWLDGAMNFLLLGQHDVPGMVREIVRKAEPDERRRPRVVVG